MIVQTITKLLIYPPSFCKLIRDVADVHIRSNAHSKRFSLFEHYRLDNTSQDVNKSACIKATWCNSTSRMVWKYVHEVANLRTSAWIGAGSSSCILSAHSSNSCRISVVDGIIAIAFRCCSKTYLVL